MTRIEKQLEESLALVKKLIAPRQFSIKVGKTNNHSYNGRDLNLKYENNRFSYHVTTKVKGGLQHHKELEVARDTEIVLSNEKLKLFTLGKYFLYNNISYPGFEDFTIDNDTMVKAVEGEITSISTQNKRFYKKDWFYRLLLPVEKCSR